MRLRHADTPGVASSPDSMTRSVSDAGRRGPVAAPGRETVAGDAHPVDPDEKP